MKFFGLSLACIIALNDAFHFSPVLVRLGGFKLCMEPTLGESSSLLSELDSDDLERGIRKWFMLKRNVRPDIVRTSEATAILDVTLEAWKAVLVSLRSLNDDLSAQSQISITTFPKFPNDVNQMKSLKQVSELVEEHLTDSSVIFQTNYKREIRFGFLTSDDPLWTGESILMMILETVRNKPEQVVMEDLDDFTPSLDGNIVTNDIVGFPFDNVYDFISEINRPADPLTLSTMTSRFTVKDLKFDTSKMKNKKDPKEIVTGINVRLTRLKKWRDLLTSGKIILEDDDMTEWSEKAKTKYQTLMSLVKLDPKRAMDTQYDKKKVFVSIIDKWSDRLKKVFKYTFVSKTKPIDFMQAILDSNWRTAIINTCKLLSRTPFLDLDGPAFTPGAPATLFPSGGPVSSIFRADQMMYEMLTWTAYMESAKEFAGVDESLMIGDVTQQVISRGMVVERGLFDVWSSLSSWLPTSFSTPTVATSSSDADGIPTTYSASKLLGLLSSGAKETAALAPEELAKDHTERFIDALGKINTFARTRSNADARSVKELFKTWSELSAEFIAWSTELIRNLDSTEMMDELLDRNESVSWLKAVNDLMSDRVESVQIGLVPEVNATETTAAWAKYKKPVEYAEVIKNALPWKWGKVASTEHTTAADLAHLPLSLQSALKQETVVVNFFPERPDQPKRSLMVVFPSLFPGYGRSSETVSEELSAFMEFYSIVKKDVDVLLNNNAAGVRLKVVPYHPLMVDETSGQVDYMHRSPHPAIVFVATPVK